MSLQAWKKAKNLLIEIAAGLYSDPPGVEFYCQRLNRRGEPAFDDSGLPLWDCSRGTNRTEATHRQIITTFGTWCTGARMSDALMREFRHRYNQGVSERRRPGFPRLGHFDTWLIEELQVLVQDNHHALLHPKWPNAADFAPTDEVLGTAPIQSPALTAAVFALQISPSILM